MKKGHRVKDIREGITVQGLFLVAEARKCQSRNGGTYWNLKLADATGAIDAKIWAPLAERLPEIPDGAYLAVSGRSSIFRETLQMIVDAAEILSGPGDLPYSEFMQASPRDIDEMWQILRQRCVNEFTYEPWAAFVFSVLDDEELGKAFRLHPAARSVHQAYVGGLLEHTLNVFELCRAIASCYPALDRQTLLAGALFHDIGKIRELSAGPNIKYTEAGLLMGHIYLGLELLGPFLAKSGLPGPLQDHFRHLVLSHHGLPEYGAVRVPESAEAFALHFADNLDAKIEQCGQLVRDVRPGSFSVRSPMLERMIYRPEATPVSNVGSGCDCEPPLPADDEIPAEDWVGCDESLDILADEVWAEDLAGAGLQGSAAASPESENKSGKPQEDPRGKKSRRNSCKGQQCSLLLKA